MISIGIPFPSAVDEIVKQKRTFNDVKARELGLRTGSDWYTTQAYRAVNQALGRCLRHKNDWGALVLIDERFLNVSLLLPHARDNSTLAAGAHTF